MVVMRGSIRDEAATTRARTLDEALGGVCPAHIALGEGGGSDDDRIAEACVDRGARLAPSMRLRAEPFRSGLLAVLSLRARGDAAEATALRTLAHRALADGATEDVVTDFAGAALDDDARHALAFALVEHLVDRQDVGARGVVALMRASARFGLDAALDQPPLHTDVSTLFSVARAAILSFHPPRGPSVVSITARTAPDGDAVVVQFDRPLDARPRSIEAEVCGETVVGTLLQTHDALTFTYAPSKCLTVDGERLVDVALGLRPMRAPWGVDGAIVARTYARADAPSVQSVQAPPSPTPGP